MAKQSFCYIMTNRRNGTLYTGVTANLVQRAYQHRTGMVEGFTKEHHAHRLVWFEVHEHLVEAIRREKQIKKWNREWKLRLIETVNPEWHDLYDTLF